MTTSKAKRAKALTHSQLLQAARILHIAHAALGTDLCHELEVSILRGVYARSRMAGHGSAESGNLTTAGQKAIAGTPAGTPSANG
jgi:hypothetical protein